MSKMLLCAMIVILLMTNCTNQTTNTKDEQLLDSLWNQAISVRDMALKEELLDSAISLDPSNILYFTTLAGIYSQTDRMTEAIQMLDDLPDEMKSTPIYFETRGTLSELAGEMDKAIEYFRKAYLLFEPLEIKAETDLLLLGNYAQLKTLAGEKEAAVALLNETLQLDWLSSANREHIELIRNELEFYTGNGSLKMFEDSFFVIKTDYPDSLEILLRENHVNVRGYSSDGLHVSEKFRSRVMELGIELE